jgi:hypothetical protein
MATYTAPAISVPAVAEHTETDPATGETVTVPATHALVTCDVMVAGSRYALDSDSMTFTVTTPEAVDPIPSGWVEV